MIISLNSPVGGLGPVFDHFVSVWKQKDSKNYPGAVHTGGKVTADFDSHIALKAALDVYRGGRDELVM